MFIDNQGCNRSEVAMETFNLWSKHEVSMVTGEFAYIICVAKSAVSSIAKSRGESWGAVGQCSPLNGPIQLGLFKRERWSVYKCHYIVMVDITLIFMLPCGYNTLLRRLCNFFQKSRIRPLEILKVLFFLYNPSIFNSAQNLLLAYLH